MKFLIFGSTGFVGNDLTLYLKDRGEDVMGISRSGRKNSISLDITKEDQFSKIDFLPDVIINCASTIPGEDKKTSDPLFLNEMFQTNVVGAANISNWAVSKNIPKIINCSTLVVNKKPWPVPLAEENYQLPVGPHVGYAMSKLSQEQIMSECVRDSQTKIQHIRLSAVYGEKMAPSGIIFNFMEHLIENKELKLSNALKNSLDLIHVRDVSKTLFAISKSNPDYNVINLAHGEEIFIYQLAEKLKTITGSSSKIDNFDSGAPPSRALIDTTRMKKIIGKGYKEFVPLETGLREIAEKFKR